MTKKYVQPGDVKDWTNGTGADVVSGQLVKLGNQLGIALVDIANGAKGAVALEGVFENVPKVSAAVFAVGETLLWDVSAAAFDDNAATPASGDLLGGAVAWLAGANTEVVCTIKLTSGYSVVTA